MNTIACLIGDCLFFVGFLIIFVLNILIQNKLGLADSQYTLFLARNWLNSPILDIQNKANCSIGNSSALVFDYWPGTVKGCFCKSSGAINIGFCSKKNYACTSISGIAKKNYTKWKSSEFCVIRLPISSYLNLTISRQGDSCPSNQQNCGIIDNLGNILCMPTTSICPINDIQMLNPNDTVPSGYRSISILSITGEKKLLAFGNVLTTGKIAFKFKVSDNTPCIDPFFSNRIVTSYILEANYMS